MEKMSDGRRHSVDIPLSKTLVALRRVRSLRDPTTNSMSKLTACLDNLEWETNSCGGIYLEDESGKYSPGGRDAFGSDPELNYNSKKPPNCRLHNSNLPGRVGTRGKDSRRTQHREEQGFSRLRLAEISEAKSIADRDYYHQRKNEREYAWDQHLDNSLKEDVLSCSEPTNLELELADIVGTTRRKKRPGSSKSGKSSRIVDDGLTSGVGSPSVSVSDIRMETSSISTTLFANEELELFGSNHRGCGIGCCWTRTPKFKDPCLQPSVEEDHILLLADKKEIAHLEHSCLKRGLAFNSDGPRSLSEKFRPKSFEELVGQHVVIQSLLNAILQRKVASLYLFYGPRGTGKTSASKIFSAALNCLSVAEDRPCGCCQECVLFFSGKCRGAKDVDAAKINKTGRVKALLKIASLAPASSQFKVFIIDECQLLKEEIWATFISGVDELPKHVVFMLITDDLDKLPRSAVSRCQRYQFPKIRDVDVVCKLAKICVQEGFEFDKGALEFIAGKSNGSLRDAETMLDQLSLLGKRINVPLVYELYGIVSDEELLDLLDLALSSDTSNTVRRARELMKSRIDPMQLVSQLANLIMDILSGRCLPGNPEAGRNFMRRHSSDLDLQKLRHALKVLSETEKQLRTSKNQTTWLTVALLQFNGESCLSDESDSRAYMRASHRRDDEFCGTFSRIESGDGSVSHEQNQSGSERSAVDSELDNIWRRAVGKCQSNKLRKVLEKGRLSSVCVNQAVAIAEVQFRHPDHVSQAERSWKLIASLLQLVLGRNVEIRVNLVPYPLATNSCKIRKTAFSFLGCSRGMQENSYCTSIYGENYSNPPSRSCKAETISDTPQQMCSSKNLLAFRNTEGNALITGTEKSQQHGHQLEGILPQDINSPNYQHRHQGCSESETQPSCFSKTLNLKRMLNPSEAACTICLRIRPNNRFDVAIPSRTSFDTYFSTNDPYVACSSSTTHIPSTNGSLEENGSLKDTRVKINCWRAHKSSTTKLWLQKRHRQRRAQLVGWILPCSAPRKLDKVN